MDHATTEEAAEAAKEFPVTAAGINAAVGVIQRVLMTALEECGVDLDEFQAVKFRDHVKTMAAAGYSAGASALYEDMVRARKRTLDAPEVVIIGMFHPDVLNGFSEGVNAGVDVARKFCQHSAENMTTKYDTFSREHPLAYEAVLKAKQEAAKKDASDES